MPRILTNQRQLSRDSLRSSQQKENNFYSNQITTSTTTSFSQLNLSRPLLRGCSSMGFVTPTPIQSSSIPAGLRGADVCASAVTGSGKTASFLLPSLERVIHAPRNPPTSKVLILTPTRELAAQCLSMLLSLSRFCSVTSCLIVGGQKNVKAQAVELRKRPDFIIATPGRLLDHVNNSQGERVMTTRSEATRVL